MGCFAVEWWLKSVSSRNGNDILVFVICGSDSIYCVRIRLYGEACFPEAY